MEENNQSNTVLKALRRIAAWLAILVGACTGRQPSPRNSSPPPAEPRPMDAVRAILEAFDRFPIVAIGEAHGMKEEQEFIASLIRHPDFAAKVNTIVIEAGNAGHQNVIDRYVAGGGPSRHWLCCAGLGSEHSIPARFR